VDSGTGETDICRAPGGVATSMGGRIEGLGVADFRFLPDTLYRQGLLNSTVQPGARGLRDMGSAPPASAQFQVVMAFDNALPHLMTDADIVMALRSMRTCLVPSGLLMLSVRDYDALVKYVGNASLPLSSALAHVSTLCRLFLREKPPGTMPYRSANGKGYGFQVWDWFKLPSGADAYKFQMFVLSPEVHDSSISAAAASATTEQGDVWTAQRHLGMYRALVKADLLALLSKAGFDGVQWLTPETTGFYQPVVVGFAPP